MTLTIEHLYLPESQQWTAKCDLYPGWHPQRLDRYDPQAMETSLKRHQTHMTRFEHFILGPLTEALRV